LVLWAWNAEARACPSILPRIALRNDIKSGFKSGQTRNARRRNLLPAHAFANFKIPGDLILQDPGCDNLKRSGIARHHKLHNFVKRPVFQINARRLDQNA